MAEAKGLKGEAVKKQIQEVIEQTWAGTSEKPPHQLPFPKVIEQRVGIAQALLGNPKVIISR